MCVLSGSIPLTDEGESAIRTNCLTIGGRHPRPQIRSRQMSALCCATETRLRSRPPVMGAIRDRLTWLTSPLGAHTHNPHGGEIMKRVIAIAAISTGLLFSTGCKSKEDKLAGHMENLTEILTDGKEDPAGAVGDLRSYMHKNLPEMAKQATALMMELDKIEDGAERAERIKEIVKTLDEAAAPLVEAAPAFGMAAMQNEEVQAELKKLSESYEATAKAMGDITKDLKSVKGGGGALMRLL